MHSLPSGSAQLTTTLMTTSATADDHRRTSATTPLLSDSGMPLENISRLVGYGTTIVTETVYRKQLRAV
ncbi:MAG: hypothetical protein QOE54_1100 [Streptosporangiaceae bacterium]|nr:hypothetical protein [Streptosporangiaceae bacterium]MDX6428734.1 hypothetical protein [Streptosporangiaceae bacterium]